MRGQRTCYRGPLLIKALVRHETGLEFDDNEENSRMRRQLIIAKEDTLGDEVPLSAPVRMLAQVSIKAIHWH